MKNKSKVELFLYIWLSFVPIIGIIFEIFFLMLQPNTVHGEKTRNFDNAFMYEFSFATIWISFIAWIYGMLNWINYFNNNMPNWITGGNAIIFIVTFSILEFLIFNGNTFLYLIGFGELVNFDTWYNKTKSVFEHIITPFIIVFSYFIIDKKIVKTKEYIINYSWFNLILTSAYSFFVIFKGVTSLYFSENNENSLPAFAYPQLDPLKIGWTLFIFEILGVYFLTWVISILINYSKNKLNKYLETKKNQNIKV